MKFSIGQLVVEKEMVQPHTSYNVQQVVAILNDVLLLEHYGIAYDGEVSKEDWLYDIRSRGWREGLQRYQEGELYTLEEAFNQLRNLEGVKTKINQEFEAIRLQLKAKLDQAAVLVQEAGTMAHLHDKSFYDLKEECMSLYGALNMNGWSHSSMQC